MKYLWSLMLQLFLLLLLIRRDRNGGGRELFKSQKWKPSHALILIFSMSLITLIGYYFLKYEFARSFLRINPFAFQLFSFLALLALLKYGVQQDIRTFGFSIVTKQVLMAIIIMFIWHAIASTFVYFIKGPIGLDFEVVRRMTKLSSWYYAVILFHTVVFAPICEEIIFRGFLYSPYRKKYGSSVAIILNSLLFSTYHPGKAFTGALTRAILYGILYEKTESIVPPIVAHSTSNLLLILTPFVMKLLW